MKKSKSNYSVEAGKLVRRGKFCPRCGMGVFLADHPDRLHCGRCGYTEFKSGVPRIKHKPSPKPISAPKKEEPKLAPAALTAPGAPIKGAGPALAKPGAAPTKGAPPAKGAPAAVPAGKPGAKEAPKKEEAVKGKKK